MLVWVRLACPDLKTQLSGCSTQQVNRRNKHTLPVPVLALLFLHDVRPGAGGKSQRLPSWDGLVSLSVL